MTEYIDDVAIPSVQEVTFEVAQEQEVTDMLGSDANVVSIGSDGFLGVKISFTLVEQIHPNGLSVEDQEDKVKSLVKTGRKDNTFTYNGMEGTLSVQSVSTPEEGDSDTIRRGTLDGLFLPWPKFERNKTTTTTTTGKVGEFKSGESKVG